MYPATPEHNHKGGFKLLPKQYRPVSLMSHVIVLKRVIKKHALKHLTTMKYINEGHMYLYQVKSTRTQLIAHYINVYETNAGIRMDTVYLDFARMVADWSRSSYGQASSDTHG